MPKEAKASKVVRKKAAFRIERVKAVPGSRKSNKRQDDTGGADKPKWRDLAGSSAFNSQTESIIIDQVKCVIPGNSRWDNDDVVDLDGLESSVDELKQSDYLSGKSSK